MIISELLAKKWLFCVWYCNLIYPAAQVDIDNSIALKVTLLYISYYYITITVVNAVIMHAACCSSRDVCAIVLKVSYLTVYIILLYHHNCCKCSNYACCTLFILWCAHFMSDLMTCVRHLSSSYWLRLCTVSHTGNSYKDDIILGGVPVAFFLPNIIS